MKFYDFLTTPELCGNEFTGETWAAHREVIARRWDGDAHLIPGEYHALACQLLGCETLPEPGEPAEMYLGFGRRSGKTRLEAAAAVHAWAQDYRGGGGLSVSCISGGLVLAGIPPAHRLVLRGRVRDVSRLVAVPLHPAGNCSPGSGQRPRQEARPDYGVE